MVTKKRKGLATNSFWRAVPRIILEWEGIKFYYLTFSLRVSPALNLTTFDAGIVIFTDVHLILSVSIMMEYHFSNFPDHAGDHRDKHTPPPKEILTQKSTPSSRRRTDQGLPVALLKNLGAFFTDQLHPTIKY